MKIRVIALTIGCVLMGYATATAQKAREYSPPIRDPQRFTTTHVRSWKQIREQNIVMQQHDYSCGAAALATLVRYYWGDPLTEKIVLVAILSKMKEEDVKDRMENGLSITDLRKAAEELGYFAELGSGTMAQMKEAKAPAIVRIIDDEFEHFVVFRGVVGDRVLLADPIRGNLRMPVSKFMCQWLEQGTREGVILIVAKEDVEELPENAPLSIRHSPHKLAVPELQAARRGLFRMQTPRLGATQ